MVLASPEMMPLPFLVAFFADLLLTFFTDAV
jgi:hypothetical protein